MQQTIEGLPLLRDGKEGGGADIDEEGGAGVVQEAVFEEEEEVNWRWSSSLIFRSSVEVAQAFMVFDVSR